MPVKISFFEQDRFVVMTRSGSVSRVQTISANERVRELSRLRGAVGIFVDARDSEMTGTVKHTLELLENFVLALDRPLPIAFLPPADWTDNHFTAALALAGEVDNPSGIFKTRNAALDWLRALACERVYS